MEDKMKSKTEDELCYTLNQNDDVYSEDTYKYDIFHTLSFINFINFVSPNIKDEFRCNDDPCTTSIPFLWEQDNGFHFFIDVIFDSDNSKITIEFLSKNYNPRLLYAWIDCADDIENPQNIKRKDIINKVLEKLDYSSITKLRLAIKKYKNNDTFYVIVNKDHRYDSINMYDCYRLIEEIQQKIRKVIPKGNITFNNTFGNYENGIRHYFNLNVLFYVPKCKTNAEISFMFECDEDFKEIIISKDYSNVEIVGIDVFIPILEALKEIN